MNNKIYYIAHYGDPLHPNDRKTSPAGQTKMNYIIEVLKNIGMDVEVISLAGPHKIDSLIKFQKGYMANINGVLVHYYPSISSSNTMIRKFGSLMIHHSVKRQLKQLQSINTPFVLYHSLDMLPIIKYISKINHSMILEVEEIYSDVLSGFKSKLKTLELAAIELADSYIFSTECLASTIKVEKNSVVCYGPYLPEPNLSEKYDDGKIHCVYAGTFDPTKGGFTAVSAAANLPSNYHVHILGFGSDRDTKALISQIETINKSSECKVTYDGLLSGKEYLEFLQKCHIGLCTQTPNSNYVNTSFPSKILVYLANGLQVLSVSIPSVVNSSIGELLYFYDDQSPESIANGIMRIDTGINSDGRAILEDLDYNFRNDLNSLINNFLK